MTEFKVNDLVRITNPRSPFKGKVGIVTSAADREGFAKVLVPGVPANTDARNLTFYRDSMEVIPIFRTDQGDPRIMTDAQFKPGDRVRLNNNQIGTVVSSDTPLTSPSVAYSSDDCERVRKEDGRVVLWYRSMMSLAPESATAYPIGATVRDTKYNLIGTVVEHSQQYRATFPMVAFPTRGDTVAHRARFGNPEGRLERVHVLTHEELTLLDGTVRRHGESVQANQILAKHLHPTVTRTFTVTVEQTGDMPPLTSAALRDAVISNSFVNNQIGVTVLDATEREQD